MRAGQHADPSWDSSPIAQNELRLNNPEELCHKWPAHHVVLSRKEIKHIAQTGPQPCQPKSPSTPAHPGHLIPMIANLSNDAVSVNPLEPERRCETSALKRWGRHLEHLEVPSPPLEISPSTVAAILLESPMTLGTPERPGPVLNVRLTWGSSS